MGPKKDEVPVREAGLQLPGVVVRGGGGGTRDFFSEEADAPPEAESLLGCKFCGLGRTISREFLHEDGRLAVLTLRVPFPPSEAALEWRRLTLTLELLRGLGAALGKDALRIGRGLDADAAICSIRERELNMLFKLLILPSELFMVFFD